MSIFWKILLTQKKKRIIYLYIILFFMHTPIEEINAILWVLCKIDNQKVLDDTAKRCAWVVSITEPDRPEPSTIEQPFTI